MNTPIILFIYFIHSTGHSDVLNKLQQLEEISTLENDTLKNTKKTKNDKNTEKNILKKPKKISYHKKEIKDKELNSQDAIIIPIFVLSDLHIHHERHVLSNKNTNENSNKKTNKNIKNNNLKSASLIYPIQPLFNKNSPIVLSQDSSTVLILHSSEKNVLTYSPFDSQWINSDLSDIDSLIAESLIKVSG